MWEYLWMKMMVGPQMSDMLASMGEQGWEAFSTTPDGPSCVLVFFKRPSGQAFPQMADPAHSVAA